MQKEITIGIAGSDGKEFRDVVLLPNTRVKDVFDKLGLRGYQLARPEGGMFAAEDNIYDVVVEGQKLFAALGGVEAGGAA